MAMIRRTVLGLLLILFAPAAGALLGADPPPLEVAVGRPVVREVTDYEDLAGRLDAVEMVQLRARVTGYLTKLNFKEGATVRKGELLFEIDPRPYQVQFEQAMSQVALHETSLKVAQATYERDLAIAKIEKNAISEQQLDRDKAAVEEARAHSSPPGPALRSTS
jgi:RND family efflux transporter MFP subunit